MHLKKEFLGYDDYLTILNKIKDYALILDLYNYGESFLNPDIIKMICVATKAGLRTRISSNLNFNMNDNKAEDIVRSGLYRLTCSIDGPNQEVYSKYRKNGNLSIVLENAKKIIYYKNKLKLKTPLMVFRMLVFEWNHQYIGEAEALSRQIGFDVFYADAANYIVDGRKASWSIKENKWKIGEPRHDGKGGAIKKNKTPCHWLFNTLVIGANGKNLVCCTNDRKAMEHMSLITNTLEEVWNSKEYIASRLFSMGLTQDRTNVLPICQDCRSL